MPGYALEHKGRDVNDEVDTEVERHVPQLLADIIVRIRPLVQSLIHHLRLLGGHRVRTVMMMVMMKVVIVGYVVVNHLLMVMVVWW